MPETPAIGPIKSKKELSALLDILAPTFNFAREQADRYAEIVGEKNYRVMRAEGAVIGGCALLPLGQFFGGASVPMMGVAAVAIAPEHRGRGAARELMKAAVLEMHASNWPISTLYPATLPLYRSVGYEQAGARFEIRVPTKMMHFKARESDMVVRRITAKDEATIKKVYRARAARSPGHLDRSDFIWHRVRQPRGQATQGFLVINPATSQPEGYCYYLQKESLDAPYSLHVTDLVANTPAAGKCLLRFLADHRSMTDQFIFQGSPDDPILKLLPERNFSAKLLDHWMVRIVNVGAALTARGYSPCVQAEVHLDVHDALLMSNNGRYVLELRNGTANVTSGGRGDLQIDIRGLAAAYTGHASPYDLIASGHLSIAPRCKKPDEALAAAAAAFAGQNPWLPDMF